MPVTICDDGSVIRHYNSRAMRQLTTKGEALNFKAMPDAEISAKNLKTRLDTNNQ